MTESIFYLTTVGENPDLADPRCCRATDRLKDQKRDDYMLVEIDPPLSGQRYGFKGVDIDRLILSTTMSGETLFPIAKWPASVYVAIILDESILLDRQFKENQVRLIARGFLYSTEEEAKAILKKI